MKKKLYLLNTLLILCSTTQCISFAKLCGLAGLTLLGASSALGVYDWVHESDKDLIAHSHGLYQKSLKYHDPISRLETNYYVFYLSEIEKERILHDVNEQILYALATTITTHDPSIRHYYNELHSLINELKKYKAKVEMRLSELQKKPRSVQIDEMIQNMASFLDSVDTDLPHLELLHDYLNHHKGYYRIYSCENHVRTQFAREVQVATDHPSDVRMLKNEALWSISLIGQEEHIAYPYTTYVHRLDKAYEKLNDALARSSYHYPDRMGWAQWLRDTLKYIKELVIAEPAYAHELRLQEQTIYY